MKAGKNYSTAKFSFKHILLDISEQNDGVICEVLNQETNEIYDIKADYVIAADGNESTVRNKLNISTHENDANRFTFCSILHRANYLEYLGERKARLFIIFNKDFYGSFAPVDGKDTWLFFKGITPEESSLPNGNHEQALETLRIASGLPDANIEITHTSVEVKNSNCRLFSQRAHFFGWRFRKN